MEIIEEDLKKFIVNRREEAYREWEDKREHHARMETYWTGYLDALNMVLAEMNKIPVVLCENLGMGFD